MKVGLGKGQAAPACCQSVDERRGTGFLWGLFYGLVPHTFCILFVVLSVIGATVATSMVQRVLLVPYLFEVTVALSLGFATLSAALYLRRNGLLSRRGIRRRWRYLATLYATTVAVSLLFFRVVFPLLANYQATPSVWAAGGTTQTAPAGIESVTLQVTIPCSGHAPLVMGYLTHTPGVSGARYIDPNLFSFQYDSRATTLERILDQEVFRAFDTLVMP